MARQIAASPDAKPERLTDQRMSTTLRIEPALLRELKYAAVEDDKKVNDLILEGVHHVLALRRQRMPGRACDTVGTAAPELSMRCRGSA